MLVYALVLFVKQWYKCVGSIVKFGLRCQSGKGAIARSGAEGTLGTEAIRCTLAKKGSPIMKWQAQRIYWKVALILGAITSLLLAAGAEAKW